MFIYDCNGRYKQDQEKKWLHCHVKTPMIDMDHGGEDYQLSNWAALKICFCVPV